MADLLRDCRKRSGALAGVLDDHHGDVFGGLLVCHSLNGRADFCFLWGCLTVGLILVRWAGAESAFLDESAPDKPPSLSKL